MIKIISKTFAQILPLARHYGKPVQQIDGSYVLEVKAEDITQNSDGSVSLTDTILGRTFVTEGKTLKDLERSYMRNLHYSTDAAVRRIH